MKDTGIIDLSGRRVKSKWAQEQEQKKWTPMMGMVLCMDCGDRKMSLFPTKVNLFKIKCTMCGGEKSFVTIVPREYERNFTPSKNHTPPVQPPEPEPPAA